MAFRKLFTNGRSFIRKVGSRQMADWYRPKFEGGDAKPNELGRYLRQCFYSDGDKIFSFGLCFMFPLYVIWRYNNKEFCERRSENCDRFARTCVYYPTATRDED